MEYKIDIVVNKSSSGKYMERFLKSLDNQEYRNFRILIVEHIDGFTHTDEDTREIVYKDKPGKILLIRCGLQDNGWKIAYNKLDCNYVIFADEKYTVIISLLCHCDIMILYDDKIKRCPR